MTSKQFQEILNRYLDNTCTEAEKQFVEDWFSSMDSESGGTGLQEDRLLIKKKLWSTLESRASRDQTHRPGYWKMWGIAAALAVVAVSTLLIFNYFKPAGTPDVAQRDAVKDKMIRLINTASEQKRIELSDGSLVWLQPGAEISYPEWFKDTREVHLSGEAFFEVTKDADHPFLVYANEVTTRVLGTSFNIKANKQAKEIVVEVKTGKVSVVTRSEQGRPSDREKEIILTPNQQAVYDRETDQVTKNLVEQPQVIASRKFLKMNYTDTPVTEIFEALEKSYGVHFVFDKELLSRCRLTTDMTDEGLYERIEIICHALGFEYKIENAEITIHAKGCN